MNIGSTLVGLLIIILCILPFFFMGSKRKKREKQMLNDAERLAEEKNCKITYKELVRDFVLAIDEKNKALFYYKITPEKVDKLHVNLAEIKSCKVINVSRTVGVKGASQKITDQLFLNFIPLNNNGKEIKIEYYNADVNVQLYGELQSIEKWADIINNCIKQKSN